MNLVLTILVGHLMAFSKYGMLQGQQSVGWILPLPSCACQGFAQNYEYIHKYIRPHGANFCTFTGLSMVLYCFPPRFVSLSASHLARSRIREILAAASLGPNNHQ